MRHYIRPAFTQSVLPATCYTGGTITLMNYLILLLHCLIGENEVRPAYAMKTSGELE